MAEQLRVLVVLAEDQGLIHNNPNSSSQQSVSPVPENPMPSWHISGGINTCRQNNNNNNKKDIHA